MAGRIVVVGAGIIGLATAYELRRRGFEVILVERARQPGLGCSAGNTGWVCPSISRPVPSPAVRRQGPRWLLRPDSPLYINPRAALGMLPWLFRFWRACSAPAYERGCRALLALAADAPGHYRQWATDGVDFEWHEDGLLILFRTASALEAERSSFDKCGYEGIREVSSATLADLEPDLSALAGRFHGALHVLPEGHVRPESACRGLAKRCAKLGIEIRTAARALGFVSGRATASRRGARALRVGAADDSAAKTPPGPAGSSATTFSRSVEEIEADAFVIAGGAESDLLATGLGSPLPLQAGKGYSITVRNPAVRLRHPLELADARVGISPFDGGLRVAGTMELSGINQRIDPRRLDNVRRSAERALPGILAGGESRDWVGMRPLTPDGLPLIGRLPGVDNVWVNTGHQMLGITLAPASAAAVVSLIAGDEPPACFEPSAFDPARF